MNVEEYFKDVMAGKVTRAKWKLGDTPGCPWCGDEYNGFHDECRDKFKTLLSINLQRKICD